MAWSTQTYAQIAWREVEPQPANTNNGTDFEFQLRESYPLILSTDRPFFLASSLSGGNP